MAIFYIKFWMNSYKKEHSSMYISECFIYVLLFIFCQKWIEIVLHHGLWIPCSKNFWPFSATDSNSLSNQHELESRLSKSEIIVQAKSLAKMIVHEICRKDHKPQKKCVKTRKNKLKEVVRWYGFTSSPGVKKVQPPPLLRIACAWCYFNKF